MNELAQAIGALKDVAAAGAGVFAAWVGFQGLKTWRRQLIGGKRVELAENALVAAYDAVEALPFIRSPLAFSGEGATRPRSDGETPEEQRHRDASYIPIERTLRMSPRFDRLRDLRTRCRLHFGEQALPHFDRILQAPNEIIGAARVLSRMPEEPERRQRWEDVIWETVPEDVMNQEVRRALLALDTILRPYTQDK